MSIYKTAGTIIAIIVLIIIGISTSKDNSAVANGDQDIVIGGLLSLSGEAVLDGESIRAGMELAKHDLGLEGIDIKLVYEDDSTNPSQTVSALHKMMALHDPVAIVGPTWSFLGDAAAEPLAQYDMISFQPATTTEIVDAGNAKVFFGSIPNIEKQHPVREWLIENNITKVAILVDNIAWGQSHKLAYLQAARDAGAEVVYRGDYIWGEGRGALATMVAEAKHKGAEVLLSTGDDDVLFFAQYNHDIGTPVPIIGDFNVSEVMYKNLQPYIENGLYELQTGTGDEFQKHYEAYYGEKPHSFANRAYDGVMMLAEAALHTDRSTDEMEAYLRSMTYDGYAATYSFDEKGDISGGEWKLERVD